MPIDCAPSRSDCIAEQVPVPAGVVEDASRVPACWISSAVASALIRAARARTVRDVHQVDAADAQLPRRLEQLVGPMAARRQQLQADDERAARERVRHPRLVSAFRRTAPPAPSAPRRGRDRLDGASTAAGAAPRTATRI